MSLHRALDHALDPLVTLSYSFSLNLPCSPTGFHAVPWLPSVTHSLSLPLWCSTEFHIVFVTHPFPSLLILPWCSRLFPGYFLWLFSFPVVAFPHLSSPPLIFSYSSVLPVSVLPVSVSSCICISFLYGWHLLPMYCFVMPSPLCLRLLL